MQRKFSRSLNICYYFARNCQQPCDWLQEDKNHTPFHLVSVLVEPLTNYFLVSWVLAEECKAATENIWGCFTTTMFLTATNRFAIVCWENADKSINAQEMQLGGFHFCFLGRARVVQWQFLRRNDHLWTWGARNTLSCLPPAHLAGLTQYQQLRAVTVREHMCGRSHKGFRMKDNSCSLHFSFSTHAVIYECLVWKCLFKQPSLKSENALAKIKNGGVCGLWLSEPVCKALFYWIGRSLA